MLFHNILLTATIGLAAASQTSGKECSRWKPCPGDSTCKPTLDNCHYLHRCPGTCYFKNKYPSCGGHTSKPPPPCKKGTHCIDDPRTPDSCGMACDIPGICAPKKPKICGGFAGFKCPKGLYCYDDPSDDCDPKKGGRDCSGICL